MADFTEEQKRFVIKCWAEDMDPDDVAKEFVNYFGEGTEKPPSAQLARYNFDYAAGKSLSPAHQKYFHEIRQQFRENVDDLPAANAAWRIRELTTLYRRQKKKPNGTGDVIAQGLLKQIAQDKGGIFNQRVNGASPGEVQEYLREKFMSVRTVIEKVVTNSEEKTIVLAAIKKAERVEEAG